MFSPPLPSRRAVLALAATLPLVAACGRTAPLETIERQAFLQRGTPEQRAAQIRQAGTELGWRMMDLTPGVIRATLLIRSHSATVDIPYDATGFEIRYVASTNLNEGRYNGTYIHPSYNFWVRHLQRRILATPVA
ncbi:hypothetical protein ACE7GA_22750 [Roseomonas sp. CCTCC AB2023176]|uniref:hypothetical protein n=1 Tax=Roseomonas sp. CCTCC AB2023176 TaxID=3342640 RepID=UPI0035D8819F